MSCVGAVHPQAAVQQKTCRAMSSQRSEGQCFVEMETESVEARRVKYLEDTMCFL